MLLILKLHQFYMEKCLLDSFSFEQSKANKRLSNLSATSERSTNSSSSGPPLVLDQKVSTLIILRPPNYFSIMLVRALFCTARGWQQRFDDANYGKSAIIGVRLRYVLWHVSQ